MQWRKAFKRQVRYKELLAKQQEDAKLLAQGNNSKSDVTLPGGASAEKPGEHSNSTGAA